MNNRVKQAMENSLNQYAAIENLNAGPLAQRLDAVFSGELNFLKKVQAYDQVFDDFPAFEALREVFFDLLMVNFFTNDVRKLEEDYLESQEWGEIEEQTIERGTELLNLLLYINECHDENIRPGLDDFLKEFLLVEEDEFQDEFHIYEDIISNQQLIDTDIEEICKKAALISLNEEMEQLFVPFMSFFYAPVLNEKIQHELAKYSHNKAFDVAVYTLIAYFNQINKLN